jgi:glucuronide carrier protein
LSEEGDLAGYIAASATNPSPVQPASAIIAIKATICLVPALAALIAMLIFIKYPLTDKVFQEIRDETEARKLAAIKAHHERPEDFVTPDRKV